MRKTLSMPPVAPSMDAPFAALEAIRLKIDATPEAFREMPVGEVASRLSGKRAYVTHKWTRGEARRYARDNESEALREVVQYLCERGPRVIAWDDESDPENESEDTDVTDGEP